MCGNICSNVCSNVSVCVCVSQVVYDWPLLQGYINRENKTAEDTCSQCPANSRLVGAVLNADPYGIAMTQVLMSMCGNLCGNGCRHVCRQTLAELLMTP